jgi:uncharacterized protein YidB (DUF937 family)
MGLLGDLLTAATSGNTGSAPATGSLHAGLFEHALAMVTNPQTGGLNGLLGQLKAGGLESAVNSWVGSGPNQAVNGSQIAAALGSPQIQALAAKFGIPEDQVASHLATILPELIHHLTPNGSVPNQSLLSEGVGLLRSRLLGGN